MSDLKRILLILLLLCTLCSCGGEETPGAIPMRELFTISTYVYDETTEEYSLQPLQLNEVRALPRCVGDAKLDSNNIHLFLSYEPGVCRIVSDERDVQLSLTFWPSGDLGEKRTYGYDLPVAREGYAVLHPFSAYGNSNFSGDADGWKRITSFRGYEGREFFLTVTACDSAGDTVATARLKLTQLYDEWRPEQDKSNHFSIEMISYEYSDMYKMMEGAS